MLNAEYKVVHSIPGRIRLRIRQLKSDADFAKRLEALVSALDYVTQVRVNQAAASMVVHYKKNSLLPLQLQEQLAMVIKQAERPELCPLMAVKLAGYELQGLSVYEYLQVQEIIKWRQTHLPILANLSGEALAGIQTVAEALIPENFLQQVIPLWETGTDNWHQEWEILKRQANVEELAQLKQIPLPECDSLAQFVKGQAVRLASVEGGAVALLGMAGEIARVDLLLGLALQTIHRTGLCYGYAPQTELERQMAWAILEIAVAMTDEERHQAFLRLQDLQQVLYQQALEDVIEDSVKGKFKDATVEAVVTRVLKNILKLESAEVMPALGIVMGIVGARAMIEEVSTAARREFQLRWLLEKQQVRSCALIPHKLSELELALESPHVHWG